MTMKTMIDECEILGLEIVFGFKQENVPYLGAVTLQMEERNFILDVTQSYTEDSTIRCDLEIDYDTFPKGGDYNYLLTGNDLQGRNLDKAEFYIDEYDSEPESITLFFRVGGENGCTYTLDLNEE